MDIPVGTVVNYFVDKINFSRFEFVKNPAFQALTKNRVKAILLA
jgi:hypothetical protein